MASYKNPAWLVKSDGVAFDRRHEPGVEAPNAGIYRCVNCDHEIGIAEGHKLPPQNHHQHKPGIGPIVWQLAVYAMHPKTARN